MLPQLTIRKASLNKRERESERGEDVKSEKNPLTLIYNWNGEQNECESEAETSHLLCSRTEAEQPSAPESVLTFTLSIEK